MSTTRGTINSLAGIITGSKEISETEYNLYAAHVNQIIGFYEQKINDIIANKENKDTIDDMSLRQIHDLEFMNDRNNSFKDAFTKRLNYLNRKQDSKTDDKKNNLTNLLARADSLVQKVKSIYGADYYTKALLRTGGIDSSNLKSYVNSAGSGGKRRKSRKMKRSKSRKYRKGRSRRQMR